MPEQTPARPLSELETRAFEALRLTPGHWAALAPVPLFRHGFRPIDPPEFRPLHSLRLLLRTAEGMGTQAEAFWCSMARRGIGSPEHLTACKLLGWHLANDCSRSCREEYLQALGKTAALFRDQRLDPVTAGRLVVSDVRVWLEAYLGVPEFDPDIAAPVIELPDPSEVARGLASLPCPERETIFVALAREIGQSLGLPDGDALPAERIDRLREEVEDIIRAARLRTLGPPAPVEQPPAEPVRVEAAVEPPPPSNGLIVREAEHFTMVTLDEAAARGVSVAEIRAWLQKPESALLFDDQRTDCPEVAIVRDPALVPSAMWVIGDVHADVLALANIISYAEAVGRAESQPPAFLFLGDFVDRGRHDHETLLLLFKLILKDPRRVVSCLAIMTLTFSGMRTRAGSRSPLSRPNTASASTACSAALIQPRPSRSNWRSS